MTESPAENGPVLLSTLFAPHRPRPCVIVKADLLPAVSLVSVVGLLGVPLGWLWSRLAPPERVLVRDSGQLIPLQLESWHRFDDLAIYGLLGLSAGVVTAVAVWLLRERRGPVIMIAATLGALLAAWLGVALGTSFASSHYAISGTPVPNTVIAQAPRIETIWVILAQPLATALGYGLLAGWSGRDDLGRRLG